MVHSRRSRGAGPSGRLVGWAVARPADRPLGRPTLRHGHEEWTTAGNSAASFDVPERRRVPPAGGASRRATSPRPDRIDLAEIVLSSRYAALEASGQISDLNGARRVDLLGRLTPDWQAINGLLSERIEPRRTSRGGRGRFGSRGR